MKNTPRRIVCFLLLSFSLASAPGQEPSPSQVEKFVTQVCVCWKPERTTSPDAYVRWREPVPVVFLAGSADVQKRFREAGARLNQILRGTQVNLRFVPSYPPCGKISVFVGPRSLFRAVLLNSLAADNLSNLPMPAPLRLPDPAHDLVYDLVAFGKSGIVASYVFLDDTSFHGASLDRAVLRLLLRALGLGGSSKVFPESIFAGDDSAQGPTLTPLDEKLIFFSAKYLDPCENKAGIDAALAAYWDTSSQGTDKGAAFLIP